MATLLLANPASVTPAGAPPALRTWLAGDWALLFSHPGDFVSCELESDRWLAVLQKTFAGARIRPLELAMRGGDGRSWISDLSGADDLALFDPQASRAHPYDLKAYALRAQISALGRRRFVMIVDDTLCNRRTFAYSALAEVPSPLEFIGWAAAARAKRAAAEWAARARRIAI
jgi:hypothetical protein